VSKEDHKSYAIKFLEKDLFEGFEQMKRETDIMKKLDHKNILKLYDIFEDDRHVYIVMELVEGSELFDKIIKKGYYSEKEAIFLIKQILEAVKYLHEHEIAHRDLKPENLLCSEVDGIDIIKIADFGLSKMFSGNEKLKTGCGTPGYVAPEILLQDTYDNKVDLWSIGVITYILLSGYSPFYSENEAGLFEKIMTAEYNFDDECWDEISLLAKDFIKKLLTKNPTTRLSANEALSHKWLSSNPDAVINIGEKLNKFNKEVKRNRKEFLVNQEQSVSNLNFARNRVLVSNSSINSSN